MRFRILNGLQQGSKNRVVRSSVLKISLLLLFASPIVITSFGQVTADASTSACPDQQLQKLMVTTPIQMPQQTAISIAQSSSQYSAITADAQTTNLSSIAHSWTFNRTSCTVAIKDIAVNFLMQTRNGSRYIVVVDVSPSLGAVDNADAFLWFGASPISVGSGTAYSGFGICSSSNCNSQLTSATSEFYQPTVSQPTGTYFGQTEPDCHLTSGTCELTTWAGLADCNYTGMPTSCPSSSRVVQAGTFATVKYNRNTLSVSINYQDFYQNYPAIPGSCNDHPSAGDQIVATVTLNSGNSYYTYVTDYTGNWSCDSSVIYGTSFTPVYAEYIAERPQNSTCTQANCQFTLPTFTTITFDYCQFTYSGTSYGAYSYYNAGDGFGVQMLNSKGGTNYQDTTTAAMTSTNYGTFTTGYDVSIGT
jgi:hypothetical protein